jgi:hypothetical protein
VKALQRLLVASHWSVFVFTAYCWLAVFYRLATKSHITFGRFFDDLFFDEPQIHLLLWGDRATALREWKPLAEQGVAFIYEERWLENFVNELLV